MFPLGKCTCFRLFSRVIRICSRYGLIGFYWLRFYSLLTSYRPYEFAKKEKKSVI